MKTEGWMFKESHHHDVGQTAQSPQTDVARLFTRCCILLSTILLLSNVSAVQAVEPTVRDIEYATVDQHSLKLDLYLPAKSATTSTPAPLVVWVHGGAWRSGSKSSMSIGRLIHHGFAIASVDYRLSPVARFPAQIHDIKASIRFLRTNAKRYHLDPSRIIIAGSSAGGHLAALVGVSNDVAELEGTVGDFPDQSSDVQSVISFFGASNLNSILQQSTPHGLSVRVPALQLLLGGQPADQPALATLASPVTHVDESDPPLLLIHGDKDPQMPIEQTHELADRYRALKRPVVVEVVQGGVHGGPGFFEDSVIDRVAHYLKIGQWQSP